MSRDHSEAEEAETTEFWNEKARRNTGNPGRAVGVDDELRNRCIENAQHVSVGRAVRRAASSLNGQRHKVLDFGCGVGRWVPLLDRYFPDYHGVDISTDMLDIARRENPQKSFTRLENFTIDAEDESFCFAFCVAVLHHNSYGNQESLLKELGRVVRPGGQLLLFESRGERVRGSNQIFYPREEADWMDAAERMGFQHVETTGTCYGFADRVLARLLPKVASNGQLANRASAFVDAYVMPYLARFLPSRYHERLMLRFEKKAVQPA